MIRKIFSSLRVMWLMQAAVMLLIALSATFLPLLFPVGSAVLRAVFLWLLPTAFGAWSACRLTCLGAISYAAWVLPPVIHTAVPWLFIGYPPAGLSMALCAFVSLVGAATGDVMYRRNHA